MKNVIYKRKVTKYCTGYGCPKAFGFCLLDAPEEVKEDGGGRGGREGDSLSSAPSSSRQMGYVILDCYTYRCVSVVRWSKPIKIYIFRNDMLQEGRERNEDDNDDDDKTS